MKDDIRNRLMELRGRIAEACEEHDRDADDISILAVTKRFPESVIQTVVAAGLLDIGESRVQEGVQKVISLGPIARYHLIGHLQSNKVKKAVAHFDVIQSVDSWELAAEINRCALEIDRTIECLIQVNASGESSKSGVEPDKALESLRRALRHTGESGRTGSKSFTTASRRASGSRSVVIRPPLADRKSSPSAF